MNERTLCHTTAHLLATARLMAGLNLVLLASSLTTNHYIWLNVLLAFVLLYLHIRIDFDRRIFAQTENFAGFDNAIFTLGLTKSCQDRPIAERAKGALKLWYKALFATIAQLALWLI